MRADTRAATVDDEHPQYVGRNLRHARLVAGLTLRDLADQVGCSESLLSKIENERAVPSLQMLHRIVKRLDTSIGFLFTNPASQTRIVMRQGERPEIKTSHPHRGGHDVGVSIEWLVPYPEGKLLSGSIHKIAPGGGSQGAITHKGEEVGYVLKGRFELNVSDELHQLNAGDSFFFPSELPHSYRNPGEVETWVLWINTPPTF
ncbi:MAG: cupin domain-containing protein [Burkholderiaceae bacterium]